MVLTLAMSQFYDYSFLLFFCLVHLESVFRWRLGAIKILLELELLDANLGVFFGFTDSYSNFKIGVFPMF